MNRKTHRKRQPIERVGRRGAARLKFSRHVTPKGFRVFSTLSTKRLVCRPLVSFVYIHRINELGDVAESPVSFVNDLLTNETRA